MVRFHRRSVARNLDYKRDNRSSPRLTQGQSPEVIDRAQAYARGMNHSMKMMWGCVALAAIVIGLVGVGVTGAYFVLLAIPCMLMMGAMVWMMVRGMGGGSRGR